jgi:hypothetical protein
MKLNIKNRYSYYIVMYKSYNHWVCKKTVVAVSPMDAVLSYISEIFAGTKKRVPIKLTGSIKKTKTCGLNTYWRGKTSDMILRKFKVFDLDAALEEIENAKERQKQNS